MKRDEIKSFLRSMDLKSEEIRCLDLPILAGYANFPRGGWILRGSVASGKTCRIVQEIGILLKDAPKVPGFIRYVHWPRMADFLSSSRGSGDWSTVDSIRDSLRRSRHLFLDDLGREYTREKADPVNDILRLILDERATDRRATYITTNCDTAELTRRYGGPTVSRIFDAWPLTESPKQYLRKKP